MRRAGLYTHNFNAYQRDALTLSYRFERMDMEDLQAPLLKKTYCLLPHLTVALCCRKFPFFSCKNYKFRR